MDNGHLLAVDLLRIPWSLQLFSPHDLASFGLGYLCRSSAPRHADAWGAVTLVTEEGQDQAGRGEIEVEWW